uniref:C2H2-type domain-containing protein n=1 Tax=Panagrellus redivivus TaxID=6233 RepID=A0A7E4VSB1_PANRE
MYIVHIRRSSMYKGRSIRTKSTFAGEEEAVQRFEVIRVVVLSQRSPACYWWAEVYRTVLLQTPDKNYVFLLIKKNWTAKQCNNDASHPGVNAFDSCVGFYSVIELHGRPKLPNQPCHRNSNRICKSQQEMTKACSSKRSQLESLRRAVTSAPFCIVQSAGQINDNRHIDKLQNKPPDDSSADYPSTFSWLGETIDIEPQPIWQQRTTRQWRQLYHKNLLRLQHHLGQHIQQQQILLQTPIEGVQPTQQDLSFELQQFPSWNQQLQKLLADKPDAVPPMLSNSQQQSLFMQQTQNMEILKTFGALFHTPMNSSAVAPQTVSEARLEPGTSNSVPTLEMPSSVGSMPSAVGSTSSTGGTSAMPCNVLDCEDYNDLPFKRDALNNRTFNDRLICSEAMPALDSMIQPISATPVSNATSSMNNLTKSSLVAKAMTMKFYPFATKRTKCNFCDRSLATSSLQRHINRFHPDLVSHDPVLQGKPAIGTSQS